MTERKQVLTINEFRVKLREELQFFNVDEWHCKVIEKRNLMFIESNNNRVQGSGAVPSTYQRRPAHREKFFFSGLCCCIEWERNDTIRYSFWFFAPNPIFLVWCGWNRKLKCDPTWQNQLHAVEKGSLVLRRNSWNAQVYGLTMWWTTTITAEVTDTCDMLPVLPCWVTNRNTTLSCFAKKIYSSINKNSTNRGARRGWHFF
jgi:hypothetical protein